MDDTSGENMYFDLSVTGSSDYEMFWLDRNTMTFVAGAYAGTCTGCFDNGNTAPDFPTLDFAVPIEASYTARFLTSGGSDAEIKIKYCVPC